MIIHIITSLEKKSLPLDYRPCIVSLMKSILEKHYTEHYQSFYSVGPKQKNFTFSVALPSPTFGKERISLNADHVKISISSANDEDILAFYNAFQKSVGYTHPLPYDNHLTVKSVSMAPSPQIQSRGISVRFLSPLVVRKHQKGQPDAYYVYDDPAFGEQLKKILSLYLGEEINFRLTPISPKKTVVKAFGVKIRASLGVYRIEASPTVLTHLLLSGMGSRRSEGFGQFVLTGEDAYV